MIRVTESPTPDIGANITKELLLHSSNLHRQDVHAAMMHLINRLVDAKDMHDHDKVSDAGIAAFHDNFVSSFTRTDWWDNHVKVNRHHLSTNEGIPDDVDLIDVLEYIVDCLVAGAARSGVDKIYDPTISDDLLQTAFKNTCSKLKAEIEVFPEEVGQAVCEEAESEEVEDAYDEIEGLVDKELWNEYKRNNKDPYGGACVQVALNVMKYLDKFDGEFNIGYSPDLTTAHGIICHCDNAGGITGFMANTVVSIVSHCYKDGWKFYLSSNVKPSSILNEKEIEKAITHADELVGNREMVKDYLNAMIERSKKKTL